MQLYYRNYTYCLVPSIPPPNVTTNVISSTAIMIIWSPPPLIYQNGFISGYHITITDVSGINSTATTPHTNYTAVGLQIYTLYNFEVAAATAIGLGPFSDPVSDQTFEDGKFLCFLLAFYFINRCTYVLK